MFFEKIISVRVYRHAQHSLLRTPPANVTSGEDHKAWYLLMRSQDQFSDARRRRPKSGTRIVIIIIKR